MLQRVNADLYRRLITSNTTGTFTVNDVDLSAATGRLLTFIGTNDTTISGLISNAGRIRKQGTGTLTITGTNTYTTILNGGTVVFGDNASFGTGQIDFNNIIIDGGGVARESHPRRKDSPASPSHCRSTPDP